MDDTRKPKSAERRAFFKKAGLGIGAAGVAAVGLAGSAGAETSKDDQKDRTAGAYSETEHVKQAYRTARF